MRSVASDDVHGRIRLGFTWDVSARSLLQLKLDVLERVYAQRLEILCMLKPVQVSASQRWITAYAEHKRAQDKVGGASSVSQVPSEWVACLAAIMCSTGMVFPASGTLEGARASLLRSLAGPPGPGQLMLKSRRTTWA